MASTFKRAARSSGGGVGPITTTAATTTTSVGAAADGSSADASTNKTVDNDTTGGDGQSSLSLSSTQKSLLSDNKIKGTKPWTGGITLTSTGLRDLDHILGGSGMSAAGQPLGTCIYLEQDRWTLQSLSLSLVKYWCTEAISHGQHLVIPIDTIENDARTISNEDHDDDHWDEMNDDEENSSVVVNSQLSEVQALLDSLPRNLHWDRQQQKQQQQQQQQQATAAHDISKQQNAALDTLQEEEEDEEFDDVGGDENEQGLQIAWQYRKSVQREMLGHDHSTSSSSTRSTSASKSEQDIFCHSFDLQGRLKDQNVVNINKVVDILLPPKSSSPSMTCGFAFYRQIQAKLQELLKSSTSASRQVVRLLFYHSNPCLVQVALPLTLTYIRQYQLPVVVMIAICPWKMQQQQQAATIAAMRLLRRMVDVVLETEGFASRNSDFYPPPPEFRNFHGLLRIVKMSTVTAATAVSTTSATGGGGGAGGHFADRTIHKGAVADLYGLKRDRRKLHIQLLHIPPEDYAQGGGSVGGGGVRSGAGRVGSTSSSGGGGGCGSGTAGGSSLDF